LKEDYLVNWRETAVNFILVVGNIKSGVEAVTGIDPITGRKRSSFERGGSAASI